MPDKIWGFNLYIQSTVSMLFFANLIHTYFYKENITSSKLIGTFEASDDLCAPDDQILQCVETLQHTVN